MKRIFAFPFALACAASAFARPLPPLPEPAFADTETTACYPIDLAKPNVNGLNVTLSFTGTSSNNVEVAFGRDADGDGELSFDETGIRLGWDCGTWFVERVPTGERFEETSAGADGEARTLRWNCAVRRRTMRSLSVANEAGAAFAELAASPPEWLYDADWDTLRVTARGPNAASERFDVEVSTTGVAIIMR